LPEASRHSGWHTFEGRLDRDHARWGFDSLPSLTEIEPVRPFIYGKRSGVARWWPRAKG
jgi:hypothetical protein